MNKPNKQKNKLIDTENGLAITRGEEHQRGGEMGEGGQLFGNG